MHLFAIVPLLLALEPALPSNYQMVFEQTCAHTSELSCELSKKTARFILGTDRIWVVDEEGEQTRLRTVKEDDYVLILEKSVRDAGASTIHILKPTMRFYWFEATWSKEQNADNIVLRHGRIR